MLTMGDPIAVGNGGEACFTGIGLPALPWKRLAGGFPLRGPDERPRYAPEIAQGAPRWAAATFLGTTMRQASVTSSRISSGLIAAMFAWTQWKR